MSCDKPKQVINSDKAGSPPPSPSDVRMIVSLSQRTDALVRGLILVLEHHAARNEVVRALDQQVHNYLDNSLCELVWLKRCKHLLTYPLAKYLRNEPPQPPDVSFTPSGPLRSWMKIRLLVFSRRNSHLWYSWFQSKRSTLPLSEDVIEKTYQDHFATLSKEDDGIDGTIDSIFENETFQDVLHRVRKSFTAAYRSSANFDRWSASSSACFEAPRSKGGQNGELIRLSGTNESDSTELLRMISSPVGRINGVRVLNTEFEVRAPVTRETWRSLRSLLLEGDHGPINCTIQAVLEPNKVRVISKGEALPYYSCRPIQRALHSSMRVMPPFRLIGRPFCPTDMIDLTAKADSSDEWFSVDYSAATDGLSWKYSGRILRFIIGNIPKFEYEQAMRVLGPHRLWYPTKHEVFGMNGKPEFRGLQRNGQLMGSILSFPILCLANLGVYLKVTERHHAGWTTDERLNHVLVNGDDMVYAAPFSLWKDHVQVGEEVGLKMSVGKAYHHKVYANVNSTSVHLDLEKLADRERHQAMLDYSIPDEESNERPLIHRDLSVEPMPYQINYLNSGLFFGQHKVQEKECRESEEDDGRYLTYDPSVCELARAHLGADPLRGLVANLNTVLSGSLPGRQHKLVERFISTHREEMPRETFCVVKRGGRSVPHSRNLFVPLSMGGMGVNPPFSSRFYTFKFKVEMASRHLAAWMRASKGLTTTQYPVPGYQATDVEDVVDSPYLKPRGSQDEFPQWKLLGEKLSTAKTLAGCVKYESVSSLLSGTRPLSTSVSPIEHSIFRDLAFVEAGLLRCNFRPEVPVRGRLFGVVA